MVDAEDTLIYGYIWFIGFLIVSNLLLFSLGYTLKDTYIFIPIWGISVIICVFIYPILPLGIKFLLKKYNYNLKILFNITEDLLVWYFFFAPILHFFTSIFTLMGFVFMDGNHEKIYINIMKPDVDTAYILYGWLYPLLWSISSIIWFFAFPLIATIITKEPKIKNKKKKRKKVHFINIEEEKKKERTPGYLKRKFNCPFCELYTRQNWDENLLKRLKYETEMDFSISTCSNCDKKILWLNETEEIVHPKISLNPKPNRELNQTIKKIYEEASLIFNDSPRASAALLRLCLENLLTQIKVPGKNLNDKIGNLILKGYDNNVIKACDLVRVHGNFAIHPKEINMDDNYNIAEKLFWLLNKIADIEIIEKQKINSLYDKTIPDPQKKGIINRNKTKAIKNKKKS